MTMAARLGDEAAHGGEITPDSTGVTAKVLIGKKPAACVGDPVTCPASDGPKAHVGGTIVPPGSTSVLIGFKNAARVGDATECKGPPGTVVTGESTVLIG